MFEDILGPDVIKKDTENFHCEQWTFMRTGETIRITVNWTKKFVKVDGNILDLSKTRLYECARDLKNKFELWGKENPFEEISDNHFKVFDGWRIK